jgi:hypothetical protein
MNGAGKFVISCSVSAAVLLFIGSRASATNLIQDPGFENADPTPWVGAGPGFFQYGNGPSAPGSASQNEFGSGSSAFTLTLKQTTPNGSVGAGVLVHYSFDLLQEGVTGWNNGTETIHILDENSSGTVLGEPVGPFQPSYFPDTSWHTLSGSFVTLPNTDHLEIQFLSSKSAGINTEVNFNIDNVVLDAPVVPEPTTVTLVVLGLFGIIASGRSRNA